MGYQIVPRLVFTHVELESRVSTKNDNVLLFIYLFSFIFFFIFSLKYVTRDKQMEEEWNQTNVELQAAREQVGELSLNVTVLSTGKKQHSDWTQMLQKCL